MATTKKLMGTTAVGGGALAIEDVFSTYLYTGNGSTQTITNGIDLAGEGGLVWSKHRAGDGFGGNHWLIDTERGGTKYLISNSTAAQSGNQNYISSFNSDGYTIGTGDAEINLSGGNSTYASWTFRKAPRFFDVVTYTGTGSARTVSHNLGVAPGCIIAKNVSRGTEGWRVYHRSQGATKYAMLQSTNAFAAASTVWNNTEPTDSVFTTGSDTGINGSGDTIVAYLFAHDPLGPSGDGSDGLIACGSYTGNGSTDGPEIDLGFEPQWILTKGASQSGNWVISDNMRGTVTGGDDEYLLPNSNGAAGLQNNYEFNSTGFKVTTTNLLNTSGQTYIYIAIRRGPMRQPTSGTEVFAVDRGNSTLTNGHEYDSPFPVDMAIRGNTTGSIYYPANSARLIQGKQLITSSTGAETSFSSEKFDFNDGYYTGTQDSSVVSWMFRRAPGFFDVVAYTGDGVAGHTVSHNLGVAPEMMWVKPRSATNPWQIYHSATGNTKALNFDTGTGFTSTTYWNNTTPSESNFTLGTSVGFNGSGFTYIAYLFATLPGVSKVGSYTGNGTSQTIDCGFTTGARFILIKRTDSTGDWYVWDTARGIVAGNDPHLSLNTTAAEVSADDSVDPDSSGFIVNQVAATNINVSSASYIFYAVS